MTRASPWIRSEGVKRTFDVVVASLVLVLSAPIIVMVALAVRLSLGSPVLFVQQRPGRDGELFRLYKFRTMLAASPDESAGPTSDARRLTRLGRLLRSSSLDELPALWNVLRGEMSLVGPRPLLPEYLLLYSPSQSRRHEVRPGITGLAQVSGRNRLDWPTRLALDVWYVEHRTIGLDLHILLLTVWRVARREGISGDGVETMERFTGTPG